MFFALATLSELTVCINMDFIKDHPVITAVEHRFYVEVCEFEPKSIQLIGCL